MIQRIAVRDASVLRVEEPLTMHLGPQDILLNMAVQFRPELTGDAVIQAVDRLETAIRSRFPEIRQIFIEASSLSSGDSQRRAS
jgi:divalent metal cation (Fe/Co/Zn/Cd) transporter